MTGGVRDERGLAEGTIIIRGVGYAEGSRFGFGGFVGDCKLCRVGGGV